MSEWTDPKIVTAVSAGITGAVLSLVSICHNVYSSRKHDKRTRRMMAWNEYKENIVDPLREALKNVSKTATDLYMWRARGLPNSEERKLFFIDLGRKLNSVEIESGKADRHPMSAKQNWTDLADIENQKIFDYIKTYNLDEEEPKNLPKSLDELSGLLNSYGQTFEKRLRERWKDATGI